MTRGRDPVARAPVSSPRGRWAFCFCAHEPAPRTRCRRREGVDQDCRFEPPPENRHCRYAFGKNSAGGLNVRRAYSGPEGDLLSSLPARRPALSLSTPRRAVRGSLVNNAHKPTSEQNTRERGLRESHRCLAQGRTAPRSPRDYSKGAGPLLRLRYSRGSGGNCAAMVPRGPVRCKRASAPPVAP